MVLPNNNPTLSGGSPHGTTEIATFIECPQKHGYKYSAKLTPLFRRRADDGRDTGTLIHVGLAHFYGAQITPPPDWIQDPFYAVTAVAQEKGWIHLLRDALTTLHLYIEVRTKKPQFTKIVAVEDPCQVYLTDRNGKQHIVTTRLDLVAHYKGNLVEANHKTSVRMSYARPGIDAAARLQFLLEAVLARSKYPNLKYVMVNPIQTSRNPDGARISDPEIIDLSPLAFSRLGCDIAFWKEKIAEVEARFPDPLNRPRTYLCKSRFGLCDFFPLCSTGLATLQYYTQDR